MTTHRSVGWTSRQHVAEAALPLQVERHRALAAIDAHGGSCDPEVLVLGVGMDQIRRSIVSFMADCRDVISVSSAACAAGLDYAREPNRLAGEAGCRMRSWYDVDRSEPVTAPILLSQPWLTVSWSVAPVEMKILEGRVVMLEGPILDGERSVVVVSRHRVLAAAWHYLRAVDAAAVPIRLADADDPLLSMSPRQRETARLLADGLTDEQIAARLEVSVRTVRYDVTRLMRLLDARSRFGAGLELGRLGFQLDPAS